MTFLFRISRFWADSSYTYNNISQSSLANDKRDPTENKERVVAAPQSWNATPISRCHATCLYSLTLVLAVAVTLMLIAETTTTTRIADCGYRSMGSYETGFHTEIQTDRNTLALKRVKFHGGIVYDENGTATITPPPPGKPDYFGLPGRETDHHWNMDLKDRFLKVDPKDWPPGAVELEEQDLVNGTIRLETNILHTLHCLNYIRKALSPEYYGGEVPEPLHSNGPKPLSLHLRHCLNQVHQLLVCQLDLTPVPRTLRAKQHVRHADVDQWHTCRDFDAMRAWMYPSEEHHT
ncbi:hypothetical protein DL95DRAFT_373868 [Leptodontidium sp. 2 PMI_412]|nr:hypothetical protein DL95DRAFT_373868 [Leptodontidium sp. 2 PMI_412]